MPLFDLDSIRKSIQQTADGIKKTVEDASGKLSESLKPENVNEAVKNLAQMGQNAFDSIKSKGEETWTSIVENGKRTNEAVSEALKTTERSEMMLSIQDALRVIYGLIAVDGVIAAEEKVKFREIGSELDPSFPSYAEELTAACDKVFSQPFADDEEYYDIIHDYLGEIFQKAALTKDGAIRGRLLLWDMLTIAYSDGEYAAVEKRLIRYVAKCMGIEYTIQLEMEQTFQTLTAIEREEEWLKHTNRPFTVIEARINELSDRKAAIMAGVRALLAD